jgi:hypothetical protein
VTYITSAKNVGRIRKAGRASRRAELFAASL